MVAVATAAASVAAAQSTNVLPDLSTGEAAFDPASAAGLPAEAKAAFAAAAAKLRSGDLEALILVASPDGSAWTLNVALKGMADYNPSDSARQALEVCEYQAGRPCALLSVNGYAARTRAGARRSRRRCCEPVRRFRRHPAAVRARLEAGRRGELFSAAGPRAFAVTTSGLWLWRPGATARQAIDKTMDECAAAFKPAACILYAVGGRVVFGAQ